MSSMVAPLSKSVLLLAGMSSVALSASQADFNRIAPGAFVRPVPQPLRDDAVATALAEWNRLRQSDSYPFTSYANFLLAHPGWPGETAMRRTAERALESGGGSPALTIDFLRRFPPTTGGGKARLAEALSATGRSVEAREAARDAWRTGTLSVPDEVRVMSIAGAFTPEDHDARMDYLLWNGATAAAARQLAFVSPARRAVFDARLGYRSGAADAAARGAAAEAIGRSDAGYVADRAAWLRNNGGSLSARSWLARPRQLVTRPSDPEAWYEVLLTNARAAAADRQWTTAYDIARQVDDAYPLGTDVSSRSLGERDDYTSLTWLAGTAALNQLGRPSDAVGLFERYARGARSPQTQSKGLYWAGRAAEATGSRVRADTFYTRAAAFGDQFYGQLATERLGRPLQPPSRAAGTPVAPAVRAAFAARETVRAVRLLGAQGNWQDQTAFVRQIAQDAKTDSDHLLTGELSRSIGRPDLGVMVGRSALVNGLSDFVVTGFPSVPVPSGHQDAFTMIHAIARQESQFDRQAVSHAGARGLMQLMPGTARETAGKIGLGYDREALTSDPSYNIMLGSTYFRQMLDYFGGSYPMAIAAYNAGPGNVNKWVRVNGDPRLPGADMLQWIEAIPISETRNYVQRVLENAVVYDQLHPDKARFRSAAAPLSRYLGKNRPG